LTFLRILRIFAGKTRSRCEGEETDADFTPNAAQEFRGCDRGKPKQSASA